MNRAVCQCVSRVLNLWLAVVAVSSFAQTNAKSEDLTAFGIAPEAQPVATALPGMALTGSTTLYWDNRPLPVTLQVGVERQLRFPAGVRLGIPAEIHERLRTQSVNGTVHWLAFQPFESTRVQVREVASGRTYLLDVRAVAEGGEVNPLTIVDLARVQGTQHAARALTESTTRVPGVGSVDKPVATVGDPTPEPESVNALFDQGPPRYDYPALTRFAFQQLYAPERLLGRLALTGVSRIPITQKSVFLYRGGALQAEPVVAWTDGLHYVTAVQLRNQTPHQVVIDPREIRGRWLARGIVNAALLPRGDPEGRDQTLIVLISPQPFAETRR